MACKLFSALCQSVNRLNLCVHYVGRGGWIELNWIYLHSVDPVQANTIGYGTSQDVRIETTQHMMVGLNWNWQAGGTWANEGTALAHAWKNCGKPWRTTAKIADILAKCKMTASRMQVQSITVRQVPTITYEYIQNCLKHLKHIHRFTI
jgi:hypothetical protein